MVESAVGRTVAEYLGEIERLPLGEGLSLLDAMLQIVGEMHRNGVADGALNPGRMMVMSDDRLVLLAAEDAVAVADADEYLSPQQREGKEADTRADVYALGVMAYRMLMGVLPYSAGNDPVDPLVYLPNLTDRVRRTFTIAVQKNLTDRFVDALTFRAALRGDPNVALDTPTLRWAVPKGDTGAADEFAGAETADAEPSDE